MKHRAFTLEFKPGDVFQINEKHGRQGFIGAFLMATEIKSFGVQGFVHDVTTFDSHSKIFLRVPFEEVDFVGKARLVPGPVEPAVATDIAARDDETQESGRANSPGEGMDGPEGRSPTGAT